MLARLAGADQHVPAVSFVPLVLFVLAFWAAIFLVAFKAQGSSLADFIWGPLVPAPPNLGMWSEPVMDERRGQLKEERWLLPAEGRSSSYLYLQVRYRDRATGEIVQVLSEERIKRKRARLARPP